MPGSLLSRSRVARHESTRSDRSDASAYSNASQNSAKKVSFNKSVRVKKYPKAKRSLFGNGDISSNGAGHMNGLSSEHPSTNPEKRFWFKVYKNRHRQAPDPREFQSDVIYYGPTSNSYDDVSYHPNPSSSVHYTLPPFTSESGTQTPGKYSGEVHNDTSPLHPSQMPTEPPTVRRNHVKKIVNRFNEEAVLQRQRSPDGDRSPPKSPPTSPRTYPAATPQSIPPPPPPEPPTTERNTFSKFKKSPIVNGVKVIFGMAPLKKKDKETHTHETNTENSRSKKDVNGDIKNKNGFYKSLRSDESDLEEKDEGYSTTNRKSKELMKSGDKFIVPTEREGEKDSYYFNGYYDDYYDDDENENRRNKIHVETWDSGNQLLFDTSDVNAFSEKTEGGEFLKTVGEKHQLWRNNKRIIVYEEPPSPPSRPNRRKAKSQNDLTIHEDQFLSEKSHIDRVKSSEELSKDDSVRKDKDSAVKQWKITTKDKGVQCSKVPKADKNLSSDDISSGKYKIIRPRNGVVSAYSHVPSLEKSTSTKEDKTVPSHIEGLTNSPSADRRSGSAIYSQVDKSKKKKGIFKKLNDTPGGLFKSRSEPLYIGPPPKNSHQDTETDDFHTSIYYDNSPERKIKTSKRSFGFHLKASKESPEDRNRVTKDDYREENWYDVDDDVKAVEQQKRRGPDHHDISEVRQELAEDEEEGLSDDISSLNNGRGDVAASVMREVDYKKREISYENVYRPEGETTNHHQEDDVGSGLWYRDADEDYRKEMAQSEVSYPAGNHVGSDRFYTLGRSENASKRPVSTPSPRAYTLDRRHLKEKHKKVPNTSGVKILVNGKEMEEKGTTKKTKGHRKGKISAEDPSSVQSDPMYVRGGLAAAYQARQRAAVRRSNSSITGNVYRASPSRLSPNIPRRGHASSEASGASSESESTRLRRPLVMYIPGISHPEKEAEEGDRNSSVNVARSQSMMTTTRPPRITPKGAGARRSHRSSRHKTEDIFEEEDDEIMPLARESKRKSSHKKQSDIRRRHSMPKDTKFSWLKWRIKGKPSREP